MPIESNVLLACLLSVISLGSLAAFASKGAQAVIILPGVALALLSLPVAFDPSGLGLLFFSISVFAYAACVGLLFGPYSQSPLFRNLAPAIALADGDYNSRENRLRRYRRERLVRWSERGHFFAAFALLDMTIGWLIFRADVSGWGIYTSLLIVPAVLLGGDCALLVSGWVVYKLYGKRYDKASQPKPKLELTHDVRSASLLIYLIVAPWAPAAMIWLLAHYGQIDLPPLSCVIGGLFVLSLIIVCYGLPMSVREVLALFKRAPSADLN